MCIRPTSHRHDSLFNTDSTPMLRITHKGYSELPINDITTDIVAYDRNTISIIDSDAGERF